MPRVNQPTWSSIHHVPVFLDDKRIWWYRGHTLLVALISSRPVWKMANVVSKWPLRHAICRQFRPYWREKQAEWKLLTSTSRQECNSVVWIRPRVMFTILWCQHFDCMVSFLSYIYICSCFTRRITQTHSCSYDSHYRIAGNVRGGKIIANCLEVRFCRENFCKLPQA